MRTTRTRKLTACVLTLVMLMTILPSFTLTALAEDSTGDPDSDLPVIQVTDVQ